MQNITPSTRPLIQFVSPNAKQVGRIVQVNGTQLSRWAINQEQLNVWEEQEISALAISNFVDGSDSISMLRQIKSTLSCPLISISPVQQATDLYRLRELDVDAVIMPVTSLPPETVQDLYQKAGSMNLLLIFTVTSENDWQKIVALKPRFIFIENSFDFLQKVPSETWLIGSTDFPETSKLKCRMEHAI